MYAKCTKCKLDWNISIKAKIPAGGYICPWCRSKKRGEKKDGNKRTR